MSSSFGNSGLSTLATGIQTGIRSAIKDLHTGMPGIVVSFDPVEQLASVQPAIKRIFKTAEENKEILVPQKLPVMINVPVIFPRGGGFSLTFPVKEGDECLLVFCERAIDTWHQYGGVREPNAKRFHSLSDAVCFVGLSSIPNKIPNFDADNVQIKKDDDSVVIILEQDRLRINATAETEVNVPNINLNGTVNVNGDLNVTGATALSSTVTSNGKDISDTHTHVGSATAPTGPISNTGTVV